MTTFAQFDESVEASEPADLYRFYYAVAGGGSTTAGLDRPLVPSTTYPPTITGTRVIPPGGPQTGWENYNDYTVNSQHVSALSLFQPAVDGQSCVLTPQFDLAIGDANGFYFARYVITTGLAPLTSYQFVLWGADTAVKAELPYHYGWRILNTTPSGFDTLDGDFPATRTFYEFGVTRTTDATGSVTLDVGWFDWEIPNAAPGIAFGPMRIYELTGNPADNPFDAPIGAGNAFYYTSADTAITFQGNTYVPALFTRTALRFPSNDSDQTTLDVAMPRDHAMAQLYATAPPAAPLGLTLLLVQRPDLTESRVAFDGQATHYAQISETFTLRFQRTVSFLKKKAPRWLLGRACPYSNGDTQCGVVRTDFAMSGATVSAVSGNIVTVTGLDTFASAHDTINPTAYFVGGELVTSDGRRWAITGQSGDAVTVLLPPSVAAVPDLAVSDTVTLFAGDDNLEQTCVSRFLNGDRFGGHIGIRERSMFEGAGLGGIG